MERHQTIVPCLWFDAQAEEASHFYAALFEDSRVGPITRYGGGGFQSHGRPEGSDMTVAFELAGYRLLALNGGPVFTFTPALSLFVTRETEAEVDALWAALAEGGTILMEMGKYGWSSRYGWLNDRYGLSWQISLGRVEGAGQPIIPALLFTGRQCGKAEEALGRYASLFPGSSIASLVRVGPGEAPDREGSVRLARFFLGEEAFLAMDSAYDHDFSFTEGLSLMIHCRSQEEIDHFWKGLARGGEEGPCGWLKDPFGVSWQVVPTRLDEMLRDPDPERVARVTRAFLGMGKFDLAALERAYRGE